METGRFRHRAVKIKHHRKNGLIPLVLLFTVFAVGGWLWYGNSRYEYFISTPVDPIDDAKISFTIKKGESPGEIAKNLKEKDLILDEDAFRNYLRANEIDRKVVAGRFLLNRTQTIPEISAVITDSRQSEFVITVPEGSTIGDIDEKLVELDLIKTGEFMQAVKEFNDWDKYAFLDREKSGKLAYPLEGYLFPDTYYLDPQNFYSENLIQMMLDNFERKLGDRLKKPDGRSLFETVIMASILEKEVSTAEDLPKVAGILWKRLDNGWMLGADATLLYLKGDRTLDYGDLQEENPYNTRNRTGLPPGPIGNPGLKSITAALNPQESPYFFYLTKPESGEVVYAVTNEEHNANKRKFLY